jgi:hypothetical protein
MIDCDDEQLEKRATRKISELALSLQKLFSPLDVVGLLIGAAVGVLEQTYGRRAGIAYIEGLLDEMRRDEIGRDGPSLVN